MDSGIIDFQLYMLPRIDCAAGCTMGCNIRSIDGQLSISASRNGSSIANKVVAAIAQHS